MRYSRSDNMAQIDAQGSKAKVRRLRDQLAFELRRAQNNEKTPPELLRRLMTASEQAVAVCLLGGTSATNAQELEEVYADALVEGHLVLHEWERWRTQERGSTSKPRAPHSGDQRRHVRHESAVAVVLRRHRVQASGGAPPTVTKQTSSLRARNVSTGGLFVIAAKHAVAHLPQGSVVVVSVTTTLGTDLAFEARAAVTRVEDDGIGLRWVDDSEQARRAIHTLVDSLNGRTR